MTLLVPVDNHTILRQLLLNEDNFLGALDHKVSAGIERTFVGLRQLRRRLACQLAF